MPRSIFINPAISSDRISSSRLLTVVCPENIKRSIVTRGLQVYITIHTNSKSYNSYSCSRFLPSKLLAGMENVI